MDAHTRCSPLQSKLNGSKSHGPTTLRGKAIASQNARKHGLLAQKPPLLASEDLITFEGIHESLVQQYHPQSAVEWHLIEQIAMCILRQRRIWLAEVASERAPESNRREDAYPYYEEDLSKTTEFHPRNRALEREILGRWLEHIQPFDDSNRGDNETFLKKWQLWAKRILDLETLINDYPCKVKKFTPNHLDTPGQALNRKELWQQDFKRVESREHQDQTAWWHVSWLVDFVAGWDFHHLLSEMDEIFNKHISIIHDKCRDRLAELDQIEADIQQLEQQEAESQLSCLDRLGIPEEKLMRYEAHINRQLKQALEQLNQIQQQRFSAGFTGSLGI